MTNIKQQVSELKTQTHLGEEYLAAIYILQYNQQKNEVFMRLKNTNDESY